MATRVGNSPSGWRGSRACREIAIQGDRRGHGHVAAVVGADAEFMRPAHRVGCGRRKCLQRSVIAGAHLLVLVITEAQKQVGLVRQLRQLCAEPFEHCMIVAPQRRAVGEACREQFRCGEQRVHHEQSTARMSGQDADAVAAIPSLDLHDQFVADEPEKPIGFTRWRVGAIDVLAHARRRVVALSGGVIRTRNSDHDQFRRQPEAGEQAARLDHGDELRPGIEYVGDGVAPLRIAAVTRGQMHHVVA